MLNPYGGPGNRIGLMFNFDFTGGDYYEVEFAPTGEAYFNKFMQGQLTWVATATHSALGRNTWFNVEWTRQGPNATVKVNNQIVFANVPASQFDHSFPPGRTDSISRIGVTFALGARTLRRSAVRSFRSTAARERARPSHSSLARARERRTRERFLSRMQVDLPSRPEQSVGCDGARALRGLRRRHHGLARRFERRG